LEIGLIKGSETLRTRLRESRKLQLFYTLGKYDFMMLVEVPSDEDLVSILLCLGSMGNVRTTTMKAWTESEGSKIITGPHP